jgi:hypothetical protein
VPKHANLDELNDYLFQCCREDQQRRIEGRSQRVGEAFVHEQALLKKRPVESFATSENMRCVVDQNGCVNVKYNRYSTTAKAWITR